MDDLDKIQTRMRLLLLMQAVGFFCWQAAGGVSSYPHISSWLLGPAFIVSGIGVGLWIVGFILYLGDAFRAKKVASYDVINDEWSKHVRKRAAETAFWIVTVGVVVSMTLTNFGLNGALLLKILTGLSVSSFLIAAVIYDLQGESGDD